nr:MAG: RNA-dependent RNA polymerase [Porcine picobirnavirus]
MFFINSLHYNFRKEKLILKISFKQFPAEVQEDLDSNHNFQMALNRLETGSKDTPRSWFYETKTPEWILGTITSKLDGMKDLKDISEYDLSKVDKFGPQGGAAPLRDRLGSLNEYFEHLTPPPIVKDKIFQQAKKRVIRKLRFNESGVPLTLKAVTERGLGEQKYNTNSGYPLFRKRKSKEALDEALSIGYDSITKKYPCTLGSRAQMGKTGEEARNIFMAAMGVNVAGQTFQMPLQDYIRGRHERFFLPWEGWTEVQKEISAEWDDALKFGADYSKMDQHFNLHHGLEVYDVIKHYFKKAYWDKLKESILYVFHVPILTNLGYIDQEHAMPSGSEWTNFLETMWNFIFIHYLEIKYHLKFKSAMGIGDDQLWFLETTSKWSDKQIEKFVKIICDEFDYAGLPGNPEKQEVSYTKTGFLQRLCTDEWNGRDGKTRAAGVYSLVRNVTSEVYPERYHNDPEWDKRMFALRCIMIAENCNQHPLFEWYVKEFLAKANDNILEFVAQTDAQIQADELRAKNIANFIPSYNQEKQDQSLLNFDTLKLLRQCI